MNIFTACEKNNIERVRELLATGMDVNNKEYDTETPLMIASKYGNIEIVRLLLAQNPKPFLTLASRYGETPMILACKKGYLDIVKLLYENGSPIDQEAVDGFTGFIYACSGGYLELAEYLLAHGANINHHNKEYDTGFTLACYKGRLEIVKLLIRLGVNINASGSQNYTGLMKACQNFKNEFTNDANYIKHKTFIDAISSGIYNDEENAGARAASEQAYEEALQIIYANVKHLDIIKLLIANKANVNHVGYNGNTALILSVLHKSDGFYELLNVPDIDIDHEDADYDTALIYACKYKLGNEQIKLLLDKDADVNHIGSSYYTPLKYAILDKNIDLIRLLLDYGAGINPDIVDFARRINNQEIITILRNVNTECVVFLLNNFSDYFGLNITEIDLLDIVENKKISYDKLKKCVKINGIKIYPAPRLNEHGESLDLNNNVLPNCSICWEILNINIPKSINKLSCGGMFHTKCILEFSKTHDNCPHCNKELDEMKEEVNKRKIKEDKKRAKQQRRFRNQRAREVEEDGIDFI
jgi:uncharacterized protein